MSQLLAEVSDTLAERKDPKVAYQTALQLLEEVVGILAEKEDQMVAYQAAFQLLEVAGVPAGFEVLSGREPLVPRNGTHVHTAKGECTLHRLPFRQLVLHQDVLVARCYYMIEHDQVIEMVVQ